MRPEARLLVGDAIYLLVLAGGAVAAARQARRAARAEGAEGEKGGAFALLLGPALALALAFLLVPLFAGASPGSPSFASLRYLAYATLVVSPALLLATGVALHAAPATRRLARGLLALGLIGVVVAIDAYLVEPARLEARRFAVAAPDGVRLERPIRVALVTDLQADRVGAQQARALREAASFRPDLLLLGGDFLQVWSEEDYVRESDLLRPLLRAAAAAAGASFAVWGNVDPRGPVDGRSVEARLFEGTGIQVLSNSWRDVRLAGVTVRVTGLDLRTGFTIDRRALDPLIPSRPEGGIHLVLSHAPDFVLGLERASSARVDLAMAGHIHGGQVVIPFFGPPITLSRLPVRQDKPGGGGRDVVEQT